MALGPVSSDDQRNKSGWITLLLRVALPRLGGGSERGIPVGLGALTTRPSHPAQQPSFDIVSDSGYEQNDEDDGN